MVLDTEGLYYVLVFPGCKAVVRFGHDEVKSFHRYLDQKKCHQLPLSDVASLLSIRPALVIPIYMGRSALFLHVLYQLESQALARYLGAYVSCASRLCDSNHFPLSTTPSL